MENGADCCVRGIADVTTTWLAAYYGHADLLHYLIIHGNPPLSVQSRGYLYNFDEPIPQFQYIYDEVLTPLHVSLRRAHFEVVDLLLSAGVMICDEQWCWYNPVVCRLSLVEQALYNRFLLSMSAPPSLEHIARHCLRQHFGQQISTVVPMLNIPEALKNYIIVCDI